MSWLITGKSTAGFAND